MITTRLRDLQELDAKQVKFLEAIYFILEKPATVVTTEYSRKSNTITLEAIGLLSVIFNQITNMHTANSHAILLHVAIE